MYCALLGYIIFEGAEEDRNMNTLVDMISGMEVKEDDEDFLNAVDYSLFDILVCLFPQRYNMGRRTKQPDFLMEVAMIVLKILAAPVMVALSLLAAMVTFLFCVASAVCELGCIVLTLLSLILFIGGQTVGGIVFLVLAFLVSPFGVPAIAEWLVDKLHSAKFALRDFITG